MKVSLEKQIIKWHEQGLLRKYKSLIRSHFPEVNARILAEVPNYRTSTLYNLVHSKPLRWNPGCTNPKCSNQVKFSDNFLDGYKKFCSVKCAANDPGLVSRREQTNLDRYGSTNVGSSPEIIAKIAASCKANDSYAKANKRRELHWLERTGGMCKNVSQTKGFGEKVRRTNLDRYGHIHANAQPKNREAQSVRMMADGARQARKGFKTLERMFGVSNPMHLEGSISSMEATCTRKYGVRNVMQDPDIRSKQGTQLFRTKRVKILGKEFTIQGYEQAQINYLLSIGFEIDNLTQSIRPIRYTHAGAEHFYFPDLAILGPANLIVETKSPYTAWVKGRELRKDVRRKAKAAICQHKNFLMLVFDSSKAAVPLGFYLVKEKSLAHRSLKFSSDVQSLPKFLRVFM